ncbi:MAG: class I SAM-dependent methyltransferase [Acidimicrobiales bacterium]
MVERRVSFDAVTEKYDRVRHAYPPEAFQELFAYLRERRPVPVPSVLEVGPGTGKATQGLLDAGARVTGVELGSQMAAYLRAKFEGLDALRVVVSSFEDVDLPTGSFDAVFAATSFHWVDPAMRVTKTASLLAPSGVIAIMSTVQVDAPTGNGYFERSQEIYAKYEETYDPGYVTPSPESATAPEFAELASSPLFTDAVCRRHRWDQTYTTAQYADLLRSYSNMQMMTETRRERLVAALCALVDTEFGGVVVRPLVIVLSMARLAG